MATITVCPRVSFLSFSARALFPEAGKPTKIYTVGIPASRAVFVLRTGDIVVPPFDWRGGVSPPERVQELNVVKESLFLLHI